METKNSSSNAEELFKFADPILNKMTPEQLRKLTSGPKAKINEEYKKMFSFAVYIPLFYI